MKKSRFTETQIVSILSEADGGMKVQEVCRKHGISPATYYAWKSKYGGLGASDRTFRSEVLSAYLFEDLDQIRQIA